MSENGEGVPMYEVRPIKESPVDKVRGRLRGLRRGSREPGTLLQRVEQPDVPEDRQEPTDVEAGFPENPLARQPDLQTFTQQEAFLVGENKRLGLGSFIDRTRGRFHTEGSDEWQSAQNWERKWLSNNEMRDVADRYGIQMAFMIRGAHAVVLTAPPEIQADGSYLVRHYDPFKDGEQAWRIKPEDKVEDIIYFSGQDTFPGIADDEYTQGTSNYELASRLLTKANYDLSIPVVEGQEWLTRAKMAMTQEDGHNCTLWSVYHAAVANAMKPGDNKFKSEGLAKWQEDLEFTLYRYEDVAKERGGEDLGIRLVEPEEVDLPPAEPEGLPVISRRGPLLQRIQRQRPPAPVGPEARPAPEPVPATEPEPTPTTPDTPEPPADTTPEQTETRKSTNLSTMTRMYGDNFYSSYMGSTSYGKGKVDKNLPGSKEIEKFMNKNGGTKARYVEYIQPRGAGEMGKVEWRYVVTGSKDNPNAIRVMKMEGGKLVEDPGSYQESMIEMRQTKERLDRIMRNLRSDGQEISMANLVDRLHSSNGLELRTDLVLKSDSGISPERKRDLQNYADKEFLDLRAARFLLNPPEGVTVEVISPELKDMLNEFLDVRERTIELSRRVAGMNLNNMKERQKMKLVEELVKLNNQREDIYQELLRKDALYTEVKVDYDDEIWGSAARAARVVPTSSELGPGESEGVRRAQRMDELKKVQELVDEQLDEHGKLHVRIEAEETKPEKFGKGYKFYQRIAVTYPAEGDKPSRTVHYTYLLEEDGTFKKVQTRKDGSRITRRDGSTPEPKPLGSNIDIKRAKEIIATERRTAIKYKRKVEVVPHREKATEETIQPIELVYAEGEDFSGFYYFCLNGEGEVVIYKVDEKGKFVEKTAKLDSVEATEPNERLKEAEKLIEEVIEEERDAGTEVTTIPAEEIEAEALPVPVPEPITIPAPELEPDEDELPAWLVDLSRPLQEQKPDEDELPDWLVDLGRSYQEGQQEGQEEDDDELPDWLKQAPAENVLESAVGAERESRAEKYAKAVVRRNVFGKLPKGLKVDGESLDSDLPEGVYSDYGPDKIELDKYYKEASSLFSRIFENKSRFPELLTSQVVSIVPSADESNFVVTIHFLQDKKQVNTGGRQEYTDASVSVELPVRLVGDFQLDILSDPDMLEEFYQQAFEGLDSQDGSPGMRRLKVDGFYLLGQEQITKGLSIQRSDTQGFQDFFASLQRYEYQSGPYGTGEAAERVELKGGSRPAPAPKPEGPVAPPEPEQPTGAARTEGGEEGRGLSWGFAEDYEPREKAEGTLSDSDNVVFAMPMPMESESGEKMMVGWTGKELFVCSVNEEGLQSSSRALIKDVEITDENEAREFVSELIGSDDDEVEVLEPKSAKPAPELVEKPEEQKQRYPSVAEVLRGSGDGEESDSHRYPSVAEILSLSDAEPERPPVLDVPPASVSGGKPRPVPVREEPPVEKPEPVPVMKRPPVEERLEQAAPLPERRTEAQEKLSLYDQIARGIRERGEFLAELSEREVEEIMSDVIANFVGGGGGWNISVSDTHVEIKKDLKGVVDGKVTIGKISVRGKPLRINVNCVMENDKPYGRVNLKINLPRGAGLLLKPLGEKGREIMERIDRVSEDPNEALRDALQNQLEGKGVDLTGVDLRLNPNNLSVTIKGRAG